MPGRVKQKVERSVKQTIIISTSPLSPTQHNTHHLSSDPIPPHFLLHLSFYLSPLTSNFLPSHPLPPLFLQYIIPLGLSLSHDNPHPILESKVPPIAPCWTLSFITRPLFWKFLRSLLGNKVSQTSLVWNSKFCNMIIIFSVIWKENL